jgi:putative sugar O-methyltransferase
MLKGLEKYRTRYALRLLPAHLRRYIASFIQLKEFEHISDPAQQAKVETLIEQSISQANSGAFDAAEDSLLQAIKLCPFDARIAPHLGRVRFLRSRANDEEARQQTHEMLATMDSMRREIESTRIYVPAEFWHKYGNFHVQLLERYGVENFKRTVSHHYQNWLMISLRDSQVRQLLKTWPIHAASEPWFNTMEVPDHLGPHPFWSFETPTYSLASPVQREVYRVAVGLLWEYVNHKDPSRLLERLTESEIGNPLRIWRKGRLISSDLAHSVRERNMLIQALSLNGNEGLTIGELGAGHGRLTEVFGLTTNFRYFIFDITPALYVSQWYIKELFPNEKIFEFRHFDDFDEIRDELEECRFAFFTSNQIEKIPDDSLSLFINMNSLMEMQVDQIRNFLHHIDRLTTGAFLSRQWQRWVNPVDKIEVSKDSFAMARRWRPLLDQTDEIYPEFFNQIWKRRDS